MQISRTVVYIEQRTFQTATLLFFAILIPSLFFKSDFGFFAGGAPRDLVTSAARVDSGRRLRKSGSTSSAFLLIVIKGCDGASLGESPELSVAEEEAPGTGIGTFAKTSLTSL